LYKIYASQKFYTLCVVARHRLCPLLWPRSKRGTQWLCTRS